MDIILGIDIGTSCVKVAALSSAGNVEAIGRGDLQVKLPKTGYAQQNPETWWEGTRTAIEQVHRQKPGMSVKGIGISGQMLGSVLLDEKGEVIEDCIIWMDQRAHSERDYIEQQLGTEQILNITSNDPLVSYWAPKLLWLKENKPKVYSRIAQVLFPKDYMKYMLTGVYDIDVTDAAGTMLFDTKKRQWAWELFEKLSIPRYFVPEQVSESTDVIGYITEEAAKYLGISSGIPVVAGGGDQMCGAVGLGIVEKGKVASMIGTSGCVFSFSERCITDYGKHALLSYCHSVPGTWCVYGCTLSAGGSYQWLKASVFQNEQTYEEMNQLAESISPGSEGLLFLPYLNGERTPYPDPYARGVFFGLSTRHDKAAMCRSVMEGVTFSLRDTIEILREQNVAVEQICAAGGGAESQLWLQIQADIFGKPIVVTNIKETPATGAAMLAAVGVGWYPDLKKASESIVKIQFQIEPNSQNMEAYNEYYKVYRQLYGALKPLFKQQAVNVNTWSNYEEKV